ncbi:hypothetical protein A4G20_09255 [Pasteurellaceae bacterium RH1A]|nr:hypothetical protein A4G20_09255 [Pasteurellaceae bacterium RH1A]
MKKLFALASLALFSTAAMAQGFQANGSSSQATTTIKTVKQAKAARDDAPVSLSGYIVKQYDEDTYLFKDSTGSIRVEIDNEDWRGVTASPKTKIKLYGSVDKDRKGTTIDVDRVSR